MSEKDILELLLSKVTGMDEKMNMLQADVAELKADVAELKADVAELKADVAGLKADVASLNERVSSLELTLENETNRNIRVIAEGHLDLSRKLDAALSIQNEKEMLLIRVNVLENEVRKLKEKNGQIA